MVDGFRRISLPSPLVDTVERLVKKTKRYRSIADFVAEAVRLRLEQLGEKGA
jgi:Arc/MetJ-type ribon-helix-helix transcriptional regulator